MSRGPATASLRGFSRGRGRAVRRVAGPPSTPRVAAERDPICNLLATGKSREAVTAILDALGEVGFDLGAVGIRQPARRAG